MSVPGFDLGAGSTAYKNNLEVLTARQGAPNSSNWLDLPGQLKPAVAQVSRLAGKLSDIGIEDVVFLSVQFFRRL